MKKYLPHLIAVAAFIALTAIFFSPIFQGKELRQMDINNWKGMAQEVIEFKEKTGEQTLWTNSMFGGMPAYQISAVYGANLIQYIDKAILFLPAPANLFFLYLAGFYFLLVVLGVDKRLAVAGAIAFAFSSYFIIIIEAGHNSKAHAIGYMAPIVAGIILCFRGRVWFGAALAGLFLALQLSANHLQITYYLMLSVLILGLTEFVQSFREKRIQQFVKASGALLLMAALALAANITNIMATQEYAKYSTRGPSELSVDKEIQTTGLDKDYITDWSYGVGESWTFLVPDFKGGASEAISQNNKDALKDVDSNFRQNVGGFSAYFGDQPFTSGPVYLGAIVCMLFLLGVFTVKGPLKWWLLLSTILSVLLSWGKNFMPLTDLFLDFVPGYDKFRAVSMILVIAEFTVPLLAILAVDKLLKEKEYFAEHKKQVYYVLGGMLLLVGLITVSPGTFTSFYTASEYEQVVESVKGQNISQDVIDSFFDSISAARRHIVVSDATRSLMFLVAGAVLLFSYIRKRYNPAYLIYGLIVLFLLDLVPVSRRYLKADDFVRKSANEVPWPLSPADQFIKQDPDPSYRVLNAAVNTFNDASTSYYHQSIGGYHGAKMKRYKELIDVHLIPELAAIRSALQQPGPDRESIVYNQPAMNMLNAKYIIYNPEAQPLVNKNALGNAWFVGEYKIVPNADAEIEALKNFSPAQTAVVDQRYESILKGFTPLPDSTAGIRLLSYKPNHLTYESNASTEQLAVFSEIYYDKGWNAFIDGQAADYIRANYVLRAMRIPAGKHTVEFKFQPQVVETGEKVALAGSGLLLVLLLLFSWMEFRRKPEA